MNAKIHENKIRLTMKDLNKGGFFEALGKLYHADLSPKTAYRVKRIGDKVESELKNGRLLHQNLVKKYAEKDEKGEVKLTDGRPGTFTIPDAQKEAFQKEQAELFDIAFMLKWDKLYLEELAETKLSASDLAVLSPLIVDPDGGENEESSKEEKGS